MNTNLRRLLPLVLLLALVLTGRSTTGIDESLEFVSPPTGEKFIRWHGVPGWTYFVQVSDPADHLKTWTFAPIIEGGNNEPISYEIDEPPEGLPDKGFFRLKYTDQVPGPNEDLDTADFDGDGLTNWDEINIHHTDPLKPDTDGDGMPDGWEVSHGLNPNNSADAANLFPGSNVSNLQAFSSGVRADPNATPTNKDGDGAEDIVDADPNDKYVDWEPAGEASYAIVELEQKSYGVWSPASVETTITRKASIGKNGLILYDVSVSHKEPEDDHFIIVSSRTTRIWKNGTWSTDLSEQITPKYDVLGKIHKLSALGVCGDHVIGNVDYSADTADWDPKSGGTRWNLEPSNGTTTRIYSPDDVGGSGNFVEGFSDQVAVSPGGALALVSGSKLNSSIAKWRGWFPPGSNASPTYVPGSGASNTQYSYEGNTIEAIEDGGSMVVRKSSGTVISDGGSEFALPNATSAARNYCICRVAKGNAGDSRLVVGATQSITNGTDYENGSSLLWIKNGSQVHAAERNPTIGRVRAIANNGVILGRAAIWRNGQSIALDTLVENQKVSGPTSATRYTNLEGLAMNGEGAIVATADDPLNSGDGHKTLILLLPVDLDFIKPGTEKDPTPVEIAEDKEDSEGEVVGINWDDDNNSEGDGGHAKLVFKNDYDDADGTAGEDDLIQLKLHKPAIEGAKARLKYENTFVKIWQKADRKDEVKSEDTEIDLTEDKIVYLEGRKLTEAESPTQIEMQIKVGANATYTSGDKVSVHVATPIITCQGKHQWTDGKGSINLSEQLHDKAYLGKNRRDDRNNTVILKGKNQQGKMLWYSVDMVDVTPSDTGNTNDEKPVITVRAPNLDKEMKMALSLEGAHVFYNGHSNFGIGPNFNVGDTTTVDDYMNLSGRGMTAITLKSTDPADEPYEWNAMKNPDHGGPDFALRPADIVDQVTNYSVPVPGVAKFTGPPVGAILTKQIHADGTPYHYERQSDYNNWITIVNSTGDTPVLRYNSCFMASCNTGRHFSETLTHGVLLFSIDETMGVIGGKFGKLQNDLHTDRDDWKKILGQWENHPVPSSWGMTQYVRLLTEGKTWLEIVTFFNEQQWWDSGKPPENMHNYKYKTF